jgi:hypothetical protein
MGEVRVVRDFLPPPEELAFREDAVKVTIALSKRSVDFFKAEASRHNAQYQKMSPCLAVPWNLAFRVDTSPPVRQGA